MSRSARTWPTPRSGWRSGRRATGVRRSGGPSTSPTSWRRPRRSAAIGPRRAPPARCSSPAIPTRSRSPRGRTALEVLVGNAVDVRVDSEDGFTPTPSLSLAIIVANRGRASGLADGIVVTPSHNPPDDGGFKYNPPNGGPADTDVTRCDPGRGEPDPGGLRGRRPRRGPARPFERARAQAGEYDFRGAYVADLENVIDMAAIRASGLRLGVDPLGGAGRRLLGPHRRAVRPRPHGHERDR